MAACTPDPPVALPGWGHFAFDTSTRRLTVYRRGSGPGVLLLHELPGMVPECIRLGESLAAAGFTIFMPLLFGRPGQAQSLTSYFCIRKELNLLHAGRSSPLADELRGLCRQVSAIPECGPRVGVIGMCLTGGFALVLALEPCVMAPVMAQPSLPFRPSWIPLGRESLDISDGDLRTVAARGVPVLAYRFERDRICPGERFERLDRELPGLFRPMVLPGTHHSVLTIHFCELAASDQSRVWEALLGHLRTQLLGGASGPPPRCN
jgi:dienelactone hydrolase